MTSLQAKIWHVVNNKNIFSSICFEHLLLDCWQSQVQSRATEYFKLIIVFFKNHLTFCVCRSASLLQHAPHRLSVLEPPPPLLWKHFPIPLPEAGLPLVESVGSPGHAAAAHLAGAVLLLPPGDLRPHVLLLVSRPHVGFRAQPAIGVPCLDGPCPSPEWEQQECQFLLTVIALCH